MSSLGLVRPEQLRSVLWAWTLSPPAGSALDARAVAQLSAVQWSFHWLQSGKLTGLPWLRCQNTHDDRATAASNLNFLETVGNCWCPGKRTPECPLMTDLHKEMVLLHFRCPWLPRTDAVERTQIPESSRSGDWISCGHDAEVTLPIHDSVSLYV